MWRSMRLILKLVNAVYRGKLILFEGGVCEGKISATALDWPLCNLFSMQAAVFFHFPVALSHVYDFTLIRVARNYDMRGQT